MPKGLVYVLFGILFQAVSVSIIGGLLVFISATLGEIGTQWISRTGLILELMGLTMLVLEYVGFAQLGQSPARWWVRKLTTNGAADEDNPPLWPRQMVILIGIGAFVMGLALQLLGSWSFS